MIPIPPHPGPWTGLVPLLIGYVGPGAGFAVVGSALAVVVALLAGLVSLLLLPFRWLWWRLRPGRARPRVRRVVILGMDGLDPGRVEAMMARGELPWFSRLEEQGWFGRLATTFPAISPVAWSTFQTGVNPGKHRIFDFLDRDLDSYAPKLSSTRIDRVRTWLGEVTRVTMLRRSRPFWHLLGEHGVFSTVLRVPISFPPEKFRGVSLSAMCAPDLRGTQGSFTLFTSSREEIRDLDMAGARVVRLESRGPRLRTSLPGPIHRGQTLEVPMTIDVRGDGVTITLDGTKVPLSPKEASRWVTVGFGRWPGRILGQVRFVLLSVEPELRIYATPINIDPRRPAMPISHPGAFSGLLARLQGTFATLGLAEDTWSLNLGVVPDQVFLDLAMDIQAEREAMLSRALDDTRRGLVVCVFDLPDRVQHMFTRYDDPEHPARGTVDHGLEDPVGQAYRRMDRLLGRTMARLGDDTVLFVLSDHGFTTFRRGVDLNAWLLREGYLALSGDGGPHLAGVDWADTRAYALGLAGIFLNVRGREARGTVPRSEALGLAREIARKLEGLVDPETGGRVVRRAMAAADVYRGPYSGDGPDVLVGYEAGYRASWDTAVGGTGGATVVRDNPRRWSGDHCVDPALVPGVLMCSRPMAPPERPPHIGDIAPTVLELLGVEPPGYMDGRSLAGLILDPRRPDAAGP